MIRAHHAVDPGELVPFGQSVKSIRPATERLITGLARLEIHSHNRNIFWCGLGGTGAPVNSERGRWGRDGADSLRGMQMSGVSEAVHELREKKRRETAEAGGEGGREPHTSDTYFWTSLPTSRLNSSHSALLSWTNAGLSSVAALSPQRRPHRGSQEHAASDSISITTVPRTGGRKVLDFAAQIR